MADEPKVEAEAGARPEWLPEQFKEPEALVRSYEESRSEMNRMRQQMESDRAQFASALEAMEAQRPTAPAPSGDGNDFDPLMAAYSAAYETGDTAAMLRLSADFGAKPVIAAVGQLLDERFSQLQPAIQQQQVAQRESTIRMAEDVVGRTLGPEAYQELLPKMSELIQSNPHYLPATGNVDTYAKSIMDVAKLAQHETLVKQNAELQAERAEKLAAATLTGAGRGSVYTPDQQKAEFERIKNTETGSYGQLVRGG